VALNKKTFRGLYIGDNHCDSANLPSRNDNYENATVAELLECLEIARDNNCDYIVFLGDIFNRIEVGGSCRNKIMQVLKEQPNGDKWLFDKYVCVGNHDIKHDPQRLHESTLGSLLIAGYLEKVDAVSQYGIGFAHFEPHIEENISKGLFQKKQYPIWVAHASIVTQKIFGKFIMFEDVPLGKGTNVVIAGHVHMPMEQKRKDGKLFINPGNVGRNAATKENMSRDIKVLLMDHNLDATKVDYKYIALKSALPAKEIFKVSQIQNKKDIQTDKRQFLKQVSQIAIINSTGDKYENLRKAGTIKSIDTKVIDKAITALKEVNDNK